MNLDERLEALTQSVGLLASMRRDTERQFQEHQTLVTEVLLSIRDSVRRLTVISEVHHERRLSQQS